MGFVHAGSAGHALLRMARLDGGALRIVEKRVDLLGACAPMPTIFLMP